MRCPAVMMCVTVSLRSEVSPSLHMPQPTAIKVGCRVTVAEFVRFDAADYRDCDAHGCEPSTYLLRAAAYTKATQHRGAGRS